MAFVPGVAHLRALSSVVIDKGRVKEKRTPFAFHPGDVLPEHQAACSV